MREGDRHFVRPAAVRAVLEVAGGKHGAVLGEVRVQVASVKLGRRVAAVEEFLFVVVFPWRLKARSGVCVLGERKKEAEDTGMRWGRGLIIVHMRHVGTSTFWGDLAGGRGAVDRGKLGQG